MKDFKNAIVIATNPKVIEQVIVYARLNDKILHTYGGGKPITFGAFKYYYQFLKSVQPNQCLIFYENSRNQILCDVLYMFPNPLKGYIDCRYTSKIYN